MVSRRNLLKGGAISVAALTAAGLPTTQADGWNFNGNGWAAYDINGWHRLISFAIKSNTKQTVEILLNNKRIARLKVTTDWVNHDIPVYVGGRRSIIFFRSLDQKNFQIYNYQDIWNPHKPYTVQGNELINDEGIEFHPRGVCHHLFLNYDNKTDAHADDQEAEALVNEWGCTAVLIKLRQSWAIPQSAHYNPQYMQDVEGFVKSLNDRGCYAVIQLTRSQRGDLNDTGGNLFESGITDWGSLVFWDQIAKQFKNWSLVGFDIYNEPTFEITPEQWRDAGNVTVQGKTWWSPGMQRCLDTIRATDAQNLVYVSGTELAFNVGVHLSHPLTGWGMVPATHLYNSDAPYALRGTVRSDAAEVILPVRAELPVANYEFGSAAPDDTLAESYYRSVIEFCTEHRMGWQAYHWTPWDEWGLFWNWETHNPRPQGRPVKTALLLE